MASKADNASTEMIQRSGVFCVNVLESGQTSLVTKFFSPMERVGNKFGDIEFSLSPNGCPVLSDALSFFECKVVERVALGDHTIFVGEVVEAGVLREGAPLTLAETGFKYGG
jgi:flavin reductase (DIM6/NTAB) family NADH-FMN oxidoreductase RutF